MAPKNTRTQEQETVQEAGTLLALLSNQLLSDPGARVSPRIEAEYHSVQPQNKTNQQTQNTVGEKGKASTHTYIS